MNIKKLFATLAGVSLFAQTVVPFGALAATYSQELQDAYNWAYGKSITTMSPIDNANMYGAITRAELAKMLANWAKDKGQTPDTSKACTFTDTASVKGDLATAIVEACQLGLMGQGITAFRPYDTISRAEFGTALSRALWGDKYEGGTPYYAKHLDALKAAGIMTQIANAESTKEVRGYVMLMLMRSEGSEDTVDCEDEDILLICLKEAADENYSSCPVACRITDKPEDVVVKAGDMALSLVANKGASVIASWATTELDTIVFKTSEDITLNSITLERFGKSQYDSVAAVWLEDLDGNKVTNERTISSSKDTVTLSIKKEYRTIKNGDSLIILVRTPDGKVSTDLWHEIGFKVKENGVDSSAKNVDLPNGSANLYQFIDYSWSAIKVAFKGASKQYNYEADKAYEVAKLKVTATNAAVLVNGFTLTQTGSNDALDLNKFVDEVEVLVDGKAVKTSYSVKNRDELRVSFADQEIAINKSSTFTVNVTLKDFDEFGTVINLWMESSSDIKATELKNKILVSVDETFPLANKAVYTFKWWKITLSNTKLDSSIDAAAGSDDVVVSQGKITLGGQAVRLDTLKIEPKTTGWSRANGYVESLKLLVNDEEYEADSNRKFKDVVIEENATIKLTADLFDLLPADETATITVKFGVEWDTSAFNSSTLSGVKYDDVSRASQWTAADNLVWSISISSIKVQPSKASLTNSLTKKVEFKVNETTEKEVFDGTYTAKKSTINLNNVAIEDVKWTLNSKDDVTFLVKIDWEEVASINGTGDADFSPITVEAGKSVKVVVVANVFASTETTTNLEYKLILKWEDENSNPAGDASKAMVAMAFVDADSITVTTNSSVKKQDLVLANKDQSLAKFIVKPTNSSTATLDELKFKIGKGGDALYDLINNSVTPWPGIEALDAEDYFEVLIGTNQENMVAIDGNLSFKKWASLIVSDINTDIEGESYIEVRFLDTLTTDKTTPTEYIITLDTVNGEPVSRDFKRTAVNSLVRVASQKGDGESVTRYEFEIEYADNATNKTIEELKFTYEANIPNTDPATKDRSWKPVQEWDSYEVANGDAVNYVKSLYYIDGDGYEVTIDSTYADFLKDLGGKELKAFAKK